MNNNKYTFASRHIGPDENDIKEMLKPIGVSSLDELIHETIPESIRLKLELDLGNPFTEQELLLLFRDYAKQNKLYKTYIGYGYYSTYLPTVICRNIFENPGWYTQYTPYQAEISQGRLEALLNYQTAIVDLTGLEVTNASLLDEGTAAAEAMHMVFAASKKKDAKKFFVSDELFKQTIDILKTRSGPQNIELVTGNWKTAELTDDMFGLIVQYPAADGEVYDYAEFFRKAKSKGIYCITAADIMSLTMLKPPGEFGSDVAVGSTQRFGIPKGYGGPHAAYFSCRDEFRRIVPGRIIGISKDRNQGKAYRMALQTREQHIRREKATSNICTSQVLLAIMAGMYAVYHGPKGLRAIAERIHGRARYLDSGLKQLGYKQLNKYYFDTLKIDMGSKPKLAMVHDWFRKENINLRYYDDRYIGISLDETTSQEDVDQLLNIFGAGKSTRVTMNGVALPESLKRKSEYLKHPIFNTYRSETDFMRYIKKLENKDLALNRSMIPLGSCTMKLNAATEMIPVTWAELGNLHPYIPEHQAEGYVYIIRLLERGLARITGLDEVSLQPNSGAQGEFTGLMVIREYHKSKGEQKRNVVLIPASAHGTNPASAVMAGMKVVVVKTTEQGDIDMDDLIAKAIQHKETLAALMITYPSTHGVFEESIVEICDVIHENGGQVYMDGANLNAQVGLTNPGVIGADVCHINLHKTFCIPHGGGGPGMGPIAVREHLAPFLPGHPVIKVGGEKAITAVSAAPWGSASILPISLAYILMMAGEGLAMASKVSILNANYVMARLAKYYHPLYKGKNGRCAHELIFDLREFKHTADIEAEDITKRLIDYGFHAPTLSFPVPGTFMFEPTESEPKAELDRFIEAMIAVRAEIKEIEDGIADREDNVLKNAPHTAEEIASDTWNHKYSREKAAYPLASLKDGTKYWSPVARVDNAYGDRNFMCVCEPVLAYAEGESVSG